MSQQDHLDAYFESVRAVIDEVPGWSFRPGLHVGLFSFSKLLLYHDLDPERWPEDARLVDHPLVRLLCGVDVDGLDLGPSPAEMVGTSDASTMRFLGERARHAFLQVEHLLPGFDVGPRQKAGAQACFQVFGNDLGR